MNAVGRTLNLPQSLVDEAERLAAADGVDLDYFVAIAMAERVGALRTSNFFAERRARADMAAFDRFMNRGGGEPPRAGDERPPNDHR